MVSFADDGKVAIVSINKPKRHNSMTFENFDELRRIMEYLGRVGSEVRAIVLTGTGKHFSAGIDVASVAEKFS